MSDTILDVQNLVGGYGKMTILNGTGSTYCVSGAYSVPATPPSPEPIANAIKV